MNGSDNNNDHDNDNGVIFKHDKKKHQLNLIQVNVLYFYFLVNN